MNILPKKSWHVRTKRNIARVRRDEAQAADEELEKERRVRLAEQEARTDLLRRRARSRTAPGNSSSDICSSEKRVNVFETDEKSNAKNIEHEKEVKAEQEKYEKGIGYLTYLGQSELSAGKPWYLESHSKRMQLEEDSKVVNEYKDINLKNYHDPINTMKGYLNEMKRNEKLKHRNATKYVETKKSHKHSKASFNSSQASEDDGKEISKIEQLRKERLKREKVERERAQQLLHKMTPRGHPILDDRKRGYHSQYNPQLSRQNQLNC